MLADARGRVKLVTVAACWSAGSDSRPPVSVARAVRYNSVLVTLSYLRRNHVQAEIAESFGVSQPTISRAISATGPLLEKALAATVPTADDLDPHARLIIDGTLLPCWSWASAPGLYSGKDKTPE